MSANQKDAFIPKHASVTGSVVQKFKLGSSYMFDVVKVALSLAVLAGVIYTNGVGIRFRTFGSQNIRDLVDSILSTVPLTGLDFFSRKVLVHEC
jgi:hypothetical protein